MGRTIIQPIGPLYGEAVNGTVFGRPNGSIYVPPTNTIRLTGATDTIYSVSVGGGYRVRFKSGDGYQRYNLDAQSQDTTSFMRMVICSDSELNTVLAKMDLTAGIFNYRDLSNVALNYQVENGETYYVAAQLVNNGSVIAVSEIVEVTGYVSE